MAANVLLTLRSVQILRQIVRDSRGGPAGFVPRRGRFFPYRKLWYKIVTNVGAGEYTLAKQAWNTTSKVFENVTDTQDPEYNLNVTGYDCLGQADGQVGTLVQGWKLCINGTWVTLIDLGPAAGELFAVRVLKTSGSAGNKTTQCSFVYTVKDLAGNVMNQKRDGSGDPATGMTPEKPRPATGKMVAPPDDTYYGLAFWHGVDLTLWDAGEIYDPTPCP